MFAEYLVKVGKAPVGWENRRFTVSQITLELRSFDGNLSYGGPEQWELAVAKWNDDKWESTYTWVL